MFAGLLLLTVVYILWAREHKLEGEAQESLELIVEWIVDSYHALWFRIKLGLKALPALWA